MTKKYNSPMLQVMNIKKTDILTLSVYGEQAADKGGDETGLGFSAGRRFDEWYEGF